MAKTIKKTIIRYDRDDNNRPLNTLIVLQTKKNMYFGIARCNVDDGDQPEKALGKKIAVQRALQAMDKKVAKKFDSDLMYPEMSIHKSLLFGKVKFKKHLEIEALEAIYDHFYTVDDTCYLGAIFDNKH